MENEPTVLHNELTPTVVRSIRIEAQTQKNIGNNIIVIAFITGEDCLAVHDIVKEIGATLTDTSFKVRRFGKDNKLLKPPTLKEEPPKMKKYMFFISKNTFFSS